MFLIHFSWPWFLEFGSFACVSGITFCTRSLDVCVFERGGFSNVFVDIQCFCHRLLTPLFF